VQRELSAAVGRQRPVLKEPTKPRTLRTRLGLRLSKDERAACVSEASRSGLSRTEWVRRVLNRAAGMAHTP